MTALPERGPGLRRGLLLNSGGRPVAVRWSMRASPVRVVRGPSAAGPVTEMQGAIGSDAVIAELAILQLAFFPWRSGASGRDGHGA